MARPCTAEPSLVPLEEHTARDLVEADQVEDVWLAWSKLVNSLRPVSLPRPQLSAGR